MRSLGSFVLVVPFLLASGARAQTTWFVDASATPPGNGTAGTPYSDLQFALSRPSTVSGDTLIVAPGTYHGGFDFLGKNVLVQSSAGAATTILDGGAMWPPPTFPAVDPTPRISVVSFVSGEGPGAVLDGFTVQHGRGTSFGVGTNGGGVLVRSASPTLRNLVVRENQSSTGAGLYFEGSTSHLTSCQVLHNGSDTNGVPVNGAGLYASSVLTVDACTFADNGMDPHFSAANGGGVFAFLGGTFTDCVFARNRAFVGGGANVAPNATLTRCRFELNEALSSDGDLGRGAGVFGGTLLDCTLESNWRASVGGGAMQSSLTRCVLRGNRAETRTSSSTPGGGAGAADSTLVDCEVLENVAGAPGTVPIAGFGLATNGGGLRGGTATRTRIHHNVAYASGDPIAPNGKGGAGTYFTNLVDCDVHDNVLLTILVPAGPPAGGGMFGGTATRCRFWGNQAERGAGAANATAVNCTFYGNVSTAGGGAVASVYSAFAQMTVRSSILWHDTAPEVLQDMGTVLVEWSDVEGGYPGTGNIAADPLFQSEANHDFHLLAGSPCIDAGDPLVMDPDGSRVDMGAFPFECGVHGYCVGKENSLGCVPTASSIGTPSFSGLDDFHVTCDLARKNSTGLLLWSKVSDAAPFFNATLCVGPTIVRTPAQGAGGTGVGPNCTGHFDFFFSHAYMTARGIVPFDTVFAQWYMRDVAHPDGTGVCVSDAVSFTVCP